MNYFGRILKHYLLTALRGADVNVDSDIYSELDGMIESLDDVISTMKDRISELEARVKELEAK